MHDIQHTIQGGRHNGRSVKSLSKHELIAIRDGITSGTSSLDRETASVYLIGASIEKKNRPVSAGSAIASSRARRAKRRSRRHAHSRRKRTLPIQSKCSAFGGAFILQYGRRRGWRVFELAVRELERLAYTPKKVRGRPKSAVRAATAHARRWLERRETSWLVSNGVRVR